MRLNLKSWKTWAGIVVAIALVWWRMWAIDRGMPRRLVAEAIRQKVSIAYARVALPPLVEAEKRGERDQVAQGLADYGNTMRGIAVENLKARGIGRYRIVRAEIRVNGQPPPDGKTVRYYSFYYTYIGGWHFAWEVAAWRYYLALF